MTIKKTILSVSAVFILAGALFLTSCGESSLSAADGYLIAEPAGKDYAFSYPENWTVIRSDGMFAIQEPEKQANISSSSFSVSLEQMNPELYAESENPWGELLEDYVRGENGYIATLSETYGDRVTLVSTEDCTVGERQGKKLYYHIKVGDDEYHFATALAILPTMGDAYLYGITYTALGEEAFSAHKAVFDSVVASFEFR